MTLMGSAQLSEKMMLSESPQIDLMLQHHSVGFHSTSLKCDITQV